jgi:hypothetical protein
MAVADFAQGVTSSNYWAAHLNSMTPQAKSAASASTGTPLLTTGAKGKSFFQNVLDIVNPLEHLPVVSTIYHAITGNETGDVEKIAGDTLYGGPIGLVSSLANVAFEKITGKDFGDTMLAMVGIGDKDGGKDDDKNTALAANTPKTNDMEVAKTAALNKASLMPTPAARIAQAATLSPVATFITPVTPALPPIAPAPVAETASTAAATKTAAQSVVDISPQTDALLASLQKNGVTGAMQTQALDAYRRTMTMNTQQSATVH